MGVWYSTVDLKEPWNDDSLSFEEKRDAVVRILKWSDWWDEEYDELTMIVNDLEDAVEVEDFDAAFDSLYDLADHDRVWINTF